MNNQYKREFRIPILIQTLSAGVGRLVGVVSNPSVTHHHTLYPLQGGRIGGVIDVATVVAVLKITGYASCYKTFNHPLI